MRRVYFDINYSKVCDHIHLELNVFQNPAPLFSKLLNVAKVCIITLKVIYSDHRHFHRTERQSIQKKVVLKKAYKQYKLCQLLTTVLICLKKRLKNLSFDK